MPRDASSSRLLPRGPGRPREFDIDETLDRAAQVFCERGYHATSIGDLTEAMQLAQGSVYKAFKDKRAVFLAAFDRNKTVRREKLQKIINAGETGRDRIRDVLIFYMEASHGAEGRRGCLLVGSAVELAIFDDEVGQRIAVALDQSEALLRELIRQGQADGSIASQIDSAAAARLMLCLLQGMRVVGKTGRRRKDMAAVVEIAMKTLV
ncbi:MAG: TetR/AcrR family transcriptional regulator [Methylocella sp.]